MIALIALATASRAQTTFEYLQGGDFEQLRFIDSTRGFAVADGGRIHFSQDGGLTWAEATTDNLDPEAWVRLHGLTFRGVWDTTTFQGWAVGEDGVILTTTDTKGQDWAYHNKLNRITSHLDTDNPSDCGTHLAVLRDIVMLDDNTGWAVGDDGALVSTANNWLSWTDEVGPAPFSCGINPNDGYQIHFFPERASEPGYVANSKGIVVTEYGRIYRTDDSGATWSEEAVHRDSSCGQAVTYPQLVLGHASAGDNLELWEVAFDDPDDADTAMTAAGGVGNSRGYIFRRAAGWDTASCGAWTQERDYNFSDASHPSHTKICGISTLYTIDALDFSVTPPRGIVGGYAGLLFTRNPNGASNFDLVGCVEETCTGDCSCTSGCPTGVVWEQTDTGFADPATMPHPFGNQAALLAGARVTDDVAILAGHFGVITRYEEPSGGGAPIITEVGAKLAMRFTDCDFWSATTGIAVGQLGEILRTTDGGVTWTAPTVDWEQVGDPGNPQPVAEIRSVAIAGTGPFAVAVGTGGHISISSDYGAIWSDVVTLPSPAYAAGAALNDVEFVTDTINTFTAAGEDGRVIISTDGGQTWADQELDTLQVGSIQGVHFIRPPMFTNPPMAPKTGYAVTEFFEGVSGKVFKTTNGGGLWTEVAVSGLAPRSLARLVLRDVVTWDDGSEVVAIGDNGWVFEMTSSDTSLVKLDLGTSAVDNLLFDVDQFSDGDVLRISGDNGAMLFRDFGTWSRVRSRTSFELHGISFVDPDRGFAVGRRGIILKYDGP